MAMPLIDILNKRFGRLLVVSRAPSPVGDTSPVWCCLCDCGTSVIRRGATLRKGGSLSCGCLKKEKLIERNKSGAKPEKLDPTFEIWRGIIRRCDEKSHTSYKWYGAKGVTICEKWRASFASFLEDMGSRPKNHTIERRDSNGNYEPGNCYWATYKQQGANRSNVVLIQINGMKMTIPDACKHFGTKSVTAHARIRRGWSLIDAVSVKPKIMK